MPKICFFLLNFEINPRLSCLRMLQLPLYMIHSSIFDKFHSRLLEPERNIVFHAQIANFLHPVKMAGTGFVTAFTAYNHLLHP